ncbi:MAG: purine-binding chemotaxis protein CheW [Candidatus Delongbacteria bacterium]|nr:purine-binding chemotaxis protein CheW [Candidatus Delongbacteria bacterium]MBN2834251.1 purine-binding chemotaxis protein CheW [Candidatus Delongbacteria bacterium]
MKREEIQFHIADNNEEQENLFLSFRIEKEIYAIDIKLVSEIIGITKITPVPCVPKYIKGVINLRGHVIPVVDIRLRFGMEARPYDETTCIIVIIHKDLLIGFIVDNVEEVVEITEDNIDLPGKFKESKNHFVEGLGKIDEKVKIILSIEKLLERDDLS